MASGRRERRGNLRSEPELEAHASRSGGRPHRGFAMLAGMVDYPPIPYGLADFRSIRREGYLYVDKTRFLRELERTRFTVFIRPRRFGKSCWISVLEHYYDRRFAGEERADIRLQPSFPLDRLAKRDNFLTLLHFFGLLSIRGAVGEETALGIPNRTVRHLLYGFLRDAYEDMDLFSLDAFELRPLLKAMALRGEWAPVFHGWELVGSEAVTGG